MAFLITTALEEFWDTSRPVLFLGEWCRRFSRKSAWGSLGNNLVSVNWDRGNGLVEAYESVSAIYEKSLTELSHSLNTIHDTKHSAVYWRLVLGPWLLHYISALYDRHSQLDRAFLSDPALKTIGLDESDFITPADTQDFVNLSGNDLYNLQIYTRMLSSVPEWESALESVRKYKHCDDPAVSRFSLKKTAKKFIKDAFSCAERIYCGKKVPVIFSEAYFPAFAEKKISFKLGRKILFLKNDYHDFSDLKVNAVLRAKMKNIRCGNDRFSLLLDKLIPFDMPKCFIEGYSR